MKKNFLKKELSLIKSELKLLKKEYLKYKYFSFFLIFVIFSSIILFNTKLNYLEKLFNNNDNPIIIEKTNLISSFENSHFSFIKEDFKLISNLSSLNSLKINDYFSISFGHGKEKIKLFVNPNCPYSQRYLNAIRKNLNYLENLVTIEFIIVDIPFLKSTEKIKNIFSSISNKERLSLLLDQDYILLNKSNSEDLIIEEMNFIKNKFNDLKIPYVPFIIGNKIYFDHILFNKFIR